jgi:16S rRNA (cytidine1402-2'-O)-methyltransferase
VLLVEAAAIKEADEVSEETIRILKLLMADLPLKQAVKLATEITTEKKNVLYELALKLKD